MASKATANKITISKVDQEKVKSLSFKFNEEEYATTTTTTTAGEQAQENLN